VTNEFGRRFPSRRGEANLLVLEPDPLLNRYGRVAPAARYTSTPLTFRPGRRRDSSRPWTANYCALSPESRARPNEDHVHTVMRRFVREFPPQGWIEPALI